MTTTIDKKHAPAPTRLGRLKLAFLYTLVGGLVASALVAIIALLIGEFNDIIQKALGTILLFVTHGLFILALITADKYNQIGRSVLPTVIIGAAFASLVTTTLSTWGILSAETGWRASLCYALFIGAAFVTAGILKLRIAHKASLALLYATVGGLAAWTLLLVPWVFEVVVRFDPFYFRLVAALTILTVTVFLVSIIVRLIALARHPELKEAAAAKSPVSGGMIAIYATVGSLVAIIWFYGFFGFLISAVDASSTTRQGVSQPLPSEIRRR